MWAGASICGDASVIEPPGAVWLFLFPPLDSEVRVLEPLLFTFMVCSLSGYDGDCQGISLP